MFRTADEKRIRVQLKDCALMTLLQCSFFSQSQLGFCLQIAAFFPAISILTIFFDKSQVKSVEGMNILIKLIQIKYLNDYTNSADQSSIELNSNVI